MEGVNISVIKREVDKSLKKERDGHWCDTGLTEREALCGRDNYCDTKVMGKRKTLIHGKRW